MKKQTETTPVKGGWVMREAASGRFVAVRSKASPRTRASIEEASSNRSAALKRLADR